MNSQPVSRARLIIVSCVGLLVIGLCYLGYITISRYGKTAVIVVAAPSTAKLTINGAPAHSGTVYLKPGTYQFQGSLTGFTVKVTTAPIGPGHPNKVAVALLAQTDAAKQIAKTHASDYQKTEAVGSYLADQAGRAEEASASITNYLPDMATYYQIGYVSNADGSVKITIHSTSPRFRYEALQQIINWGYDPTTLDIDFVDYKNPLGN